MQGECVHDGCTKSQWHGQLGYCVMHLRRFERGRPMDAPEQRRGLSLRDRFYQHVDVRDLQECWPWTGAIDAQGYGRFGVDQGGQRWDYRPAHCVAWELEHGQPIEGWGLHRCDNPPCCNWAHVYEGDALLNSQDAIARGRYHRGALPQRNTARGIRSGLAKLDDEAVRAIRRRYERRRLPGERVTQQQLAVEYGVNQTKISDVVRRTTWAHVPD